MERNLLIVDDELEIVSWLEEMFRYDFDREIGVYTARSGKAALELLNRVRFDVVLTDIHMPQMDGITLFHKVKENWPRCKTVFLTGYQNFDDVYSVFQHRDVRYVLKSERDEVIKKAVSDAFADLEAQLEEERVRRLEKEKLENADQWMKRDFFQDALNGRLTEGQKKQAADSLRLSLQPDRELLLFLLRVDEVAENGEEQTENLISLLKEGMPERLRYEIYLQEHRHIFLFLQPEKAEDTDWAGIFEVGLGAVENVQEMFRNTWGITFSAVVREKLLSVDGLANVSSRMKQIMVGYVGKNHELILREDTLEKEMTEAQPQNAISLVPMLRSYLELGKQTEYFGVLSELSSEMQGKSRHDIYAMELYYSIATLLLQFINENHIYMQLAFRIGMYRLMKADEHENWMEAAQFLFEVSEAVFELLGERENTLTERALNRVIHYIDTHLSEDLPLKTLADVGGFNASYLSRLFRQTCDQTITEYILNKRMDAAKKLLEETDEKIQDISAGTGYISAQSFARAFRNSTGLSPAEWREMHRKENR